MSRSALLKIALAAISGLALPAPASAGAVVGLKRVDESLVAAVTERVTSDASPAVIADAIRTLYRMGYFSTVRVERDGDALTWHFVERPFVVAIDKKGIDKLTTEKVDAAIKIKPLAFLSPEDVRATEDELRKLYREDGYAETEVVVRTEPTDTPGDVRVIVEAREVGKVRVVEVRIGGNAHLAERDLLARLESKTPNALSFLTSRGVYDAEAAERDRYRLEGAYLEQGYLKVQTSGPYVTYLPAGDRVIVEYRVVENLQYFLGELTFAGDLFFKESTLRDWVGIERGEPVNRVQLEAAIQRMTEAYSDFGFAFARITPDFTYDDEHRIADVRITIARGPLVYVNRINIVGNTKTRDKVVRRELTIREGELFSGGSVRLSRERVYALGFFEAVTFETNAVGDDMLDLEIQVTERPTGTASAGLGYSSLDKFVGNLRLNFGNLAGYGLRLDLQAEFGARRQTFSVGFDDPYFLDSPFNMGIDLSRSRQEFTSTAADVQTYTQDNIGASLSFGYKLALYTRVIATLRDELVEYSNVAVASPRFFTAGETRSLSLALRRDSRNHPYDPQRGNMTLLSVEFAGGPIGGDHSFTKYRAVTQQFYTVLKYFTLMGRAELGLATARAERVPFSERYFLGGIYTLRGYDFRAVGPVLLVPTDPRDPYSNVSRVFVGGNKQLLFTGELLFPLIPPAGIKGVVFFDAGNTWLEEDRLWSSALRMGYGTGFRWFSPIGPLRFEWGFPIKRQVGERARVFEFSIGTFF